MLDLYAIEWRKKWKFSLYSRACVHACIVRVFLMTFLVLCTTDRAERSEERNRKGKARPRGCVLEGGRAGRGQFAACDARTSAF